MVLDVASIRGVKDKLPHGRYALLCSQLSKLGGPPLVWDKNKLAGSAATPPVLHRGSHTDLSLDFNSEVQMSCPSEVDLGVSNVLLFQLFKLRSQRTPYDAVVAWGALPLSTITFDLIQGKFRLPLVRGDVDLSVTRYRDIQSIISKNIDAWLGNLYVDIRVLPVDTAGNDIALSATGALLRLGSDAVLEAIEGTAMPVGEEKASGPVVRAPQHVVRAVGHQWEEFHHSARPTDGQRSTVRAGRTKSIHSSRQLSYNRLRFVGKYLASDFEFTSKVSLEFWVQCALLLTALYVRIFIHFIGASSWLALLFAYYP